MGNPVVRFEIGAADDQALTRFYGALFGWGLQAVADGSTVVDTRGGTGINGGIGRSQSGEPWATFHVEVEDPQACLERAGALGGRTVWPVTELPGVPEGAYGQVAAGAEHGIGGGIGAGGEARWATVYASVGDVEATLGRAEGLGATREYGPDQVDDHTWTGMFRDPAGNRFGVYRHGPH